MVLSMVHQQGQSSPAGTEDRQMSNLFTVRGYDESDKITVKIDCDLAKNAVKIMENVISNGAHRAEAFNNHYKIVVLARHSIRLQPE